MSSVLFSDVATDESYHQNDDISYESDNHYGMNDNLCNISIKTRIIGAIICIVIGIILNSIALGFLFTFQLTTFSVIYVFGTISSIGSSFFIAGPKKHIEALKFKPHLIAGIILITCIIMIFILACGVKIGILALFFVIAEVLDMIIFNLTLHEKMLDKFKSLFFKCIKKDHNNINKSNDQCSNCLQDNYNNSSY